MDYWELKLDEGVLICINPVIIGWLLLFAWDSERSTIFQMKNVVSLTHILNDLNDYARMVLLVVIAVCLDCGRNLSLGNHKYRVAAMIIGIITTCLVYIICAVDRYMNFLEIFFMKRDVGTNGSIVAVLLIWGYHASRIMLFGCVRLSVCHNGLVSLRLLVGCLWLSTITQYLTWWSVTVD